MPSVKIENKSARILHISLGGGQVVTVPPTVGGVTVTFTDTEQAAFDKNVATPKVQEWIEVGDLVITPGEPEKPPPEPEEPPPEPEADEEEDAP